MRALIQRVSSAQVEVNKEIIGKIKQGYLIFLGVGKNDNLETAGRLWQKINNLRIFEDENGKTNLNLAKVGGEVLIVSQFTLWANTKHGNRPSFIEAGPPEMAENLYEEFIKLAQKDVANVQRGQFGAEMQVSLTNDGPFTVWLDTDLW